jgi:hypothetical protein
MAEPLSEPELRQSLRRPTQIQESCVWCGWRPRAGLTEKSPTVRDAQTIRVTSPVHTASSVSSDEPSCSSSRQKPGCQPPREASFPGAILRPALHNPKEKRAATFNAHNLDGFAEVLADDVVFKAPGAIQDEGAAACAAFFGG